MTQHDEIAPNLIKVIRFAANKHKNQRRKNRDATPYINHPIEVAYTLINEGGVTDTDILSAAILHDVIEDTSTTAEELSELFGENVASIVLEVSDNRKLPKSERKRLQIEHAPHLSEGAKLVKLSDKICNLRDVHNDPPWGWERERCVAYFDWAVLVIDGLRGVNPPLEKIFDQIVADFRNKDDV